jgi:hypothetical protein
MTRVAAKRRSPGTAVAAALLVGAAAAVGPPSAHATSVTFDFQAWIENALPSASDDRERGFQNSSPFQLGVGGLTLTATAFELPGNTASHVYLDGEFNGFIGGMGVCSLLNAQNQCAPSSDDNVSIDGARQEKLVLGFDRNLRSFSVTLRDSEHFLFNGLNTPGGPDDTDSGRFEYKYGNSGWMTATTNAAGVFAAVLDGSSSQLNFRAVKSGLANQFYLASATVTPVPLPAAAWLLFSAMASFGALARRR